MKGKPFFLYAAFNAPHWPIQGPEDSGKQVVLKEWSQGARDFRITRLGSRRHRQPGMAAATWRHTSQRAGDSGIPDASFGGTAKTKSAPRQGFTQKRNCITRSLLQHAPKLRFFWLWHFEFLRMNISIPVRPNLARAREILGLPPASLAERTQAPQTGAGSRARRAGPGVQAGRRSVGACRGPNNDLAAPVQSFYCNQGIRSMTSTCRATHLSVRLLIHESCLRACGPD